jgi:atypical dual specificity phosphatase
MSPTHSGEMLWWVIPGVLAGMPMPFISPERRLNGGGDMTAYEDELNQLHGAGIRAVVSLLNLPSDEALYQKAGFTFLCLPVADGHAPTPVQALDFVRFITEQRQATRPVAVHCEAGLGRTGTMLALYMISQGETAPAAILRIRQIEPAAIETQNQVAFLYEFQKQQR